MQGISPTFLSKIFPKLEKAGIVEASDGIRGGYRLARSPETITVLDVVDAVEGHKPLFDCQEIRGRCALFAGNPPAWSTSGVCGIHAVMLRAEALMREELAKTTLATLSAGFLTKRLPPTFPAEVKRWFADRQVAREGARVSGLKKRARSRKASDEA